MIYADTSVLVALLVNDSNTTKALELLTSMRRPLVFNRLLKLELGNALQLNLSAKKLKARDVSVAELLIEDLIKSNRWIEVEPDWERVFDRARGLSKAHTKQTYSRSLDILHVACAMELQVRKFFSFDDRQCQLAERAGLSVV